MTKELTEYLPNDLLEKYGIYIGFFAVFVFFCFMSPNFLSQRNVFNIIVQSSVIAIIAIGETIVISTGGIDLSVGSVVALVSVALGLMLISPLPIFLAVSFSILLGTAVGLVNGLIISYGNMPSFIVTLGMMSIAKGAALMLNGGQPVASLPMGFDKIATTDIFGVPIFVVYVIVAYSIMFIILNKHKLGRYIYAIGDNEAAARLSGINVKKIRTTSFVFGVLFAGIGAVMLTARLNYATPLSGSGFELDAIAAAVIGGTALSGGKGSIVGTVVGALLLGTLKNGLTLMNVSSFFQQVIIGTVIILAVFVDKLRSQ